MCAEEPALALRPGDGGAGGMLRSATLNPVTQSESRKLKVSSAAVKHLLRIVGIALVSWLAAADAAPATGGLFFASANDQAGGGAAVSATGWRALARGHKCDVPGRSSAIGVNINNLSFQSLNAPNLVSAIRQSGATWIRINLFWAWTEPQPGVFNWQAADKGLAVLQANHINVLLTLLGPVPCWALAQKSAGTCTAPRVTVPPPGPWADFVRAAVTRYSGVVSYYEIWNEPDSRNGLDTPDNHQRLIDYRDNILIPGAQAVHAASPTAKVVAPVFATNASWGTGPGAGLEQALALVLGGSVGRSVDIVSLHTYLPYDPVESGRSAHSALRALGMDERPLWLSEVGVAPGGRFADPEVYRAAQTSLIRGKLSQILADQTFDKVFWFALTDSTNRAGEHVDPFGLIDNSDYSTFAWTPRPSFTALAQLSRSNCRQ